MANAQPRDLVWTLLPSDRFPEIAPQWDALNVRTCNLPFLESLFLAPLLRVFGEGNEHVALCHRGDMLVAAMIVCRVGAGRWQTFQPSQLPLGPVLVDPSLKMSDIAPALLARFPGLGLSLGLTQLDPSFTARPEDCATLATMDYIQTAWVEVVGTFDEYWNGRGKNLRQNMRKQRNRLVKEGVETELEVLSAVEVVEDALADYGRLEAASWKADTGTAITADNDQGRFYAQMLRSFCAVGRGAIYRYRIGGRVAAMDLCIISGDTLVILKTTYDASDKTLSPAFLMREEQFGRIWAEATIKRIEFYGKVMEWHTRWTELARTLYHLTCFRWPAVKSLQQLRHRLRERQSSTQNHIDQVHHEQE